jgi:hypothetical protein
MPPFSPCDRSRVQEPASIVEYATAMRKGEAEAGGDTQRVRDLEDASAAGMRPGLVSLYNQLKINADSSVRPVVPRLDVEQA